MMAIATLVIGHAVMIAMMYDDVTSLIVGEPRTKSLR